MKTKITAKTMAVVAVLGLSRAAFADGTFTPVEDLSPEQRREVFEKLSETTNGAELDWDHIAVGVNENGEVVVKQRSEIQIQGMSQPSCFTRE